MTGRRDRPLHYGPRCEYFIRVYSFGQLKCYYISVAKKYGFNNQEIAKLLRDVAAALTLKNVSIFQIRAYETAADAIEHSTSEVKDLFEEGKLVQIPGVGANLAKYLEELFKEGKVVHFEAIKRGIEPVVFELLDIPGV